MTYYNNRERELTLTLKMGRDTEFGRSRSREFQPLMADGKKDFRKREVLQWHINKAIIQYVTQISNSFTFEKSKKVKSSVRLIQKCADLICIPICDIFNQSISIGIFPEDWKYVRVTPLFKQRNKVDPDNYRPISAISVVTKMKVFERIVCDQLYSYLELHHL